MSFQVLGCPNCQQPFQVAAEHAGQVVQCPSCAEAVEVPGNALGVQPTSSSPEPQLFACPVCSGQFGVSADMFGQQVGCPHCQASVLIQAPGDPGQLNEAEIEMAPLIVTDTPASKRKKNKKDVADAPATDDGEEEKASFASRFKTKKKTVLPSGPESTSTPERPIQPVVDKSERAHRVEIQTAVDESASVTDRVGELTESGKEPIDHLLPPRFDVLDPSRMRMDVEKGQFKVLLPDGKGGTTQFDERVMHVEHEGHQVSLVSLSPAQRARRRLIQNIIAIVIAIIIMAIAFTILR